MVSAQTPLGKFHHLPKIPRDPILMHPLQLSVIAAQVLIATVLSPRTTELVAALVLVPLEEVMALASEEVGCTLIFEATRGILLRRYRCFAFADIHDRSRR